MVTLSRISNPQPRHRPTELPHHAPGSKGEIFLNLSMKGDLDEMSLITCTMKSQSYVLRILRSPRPAALRPILRPTLQPRLCPKCGQSCLPRRRYIHTPAEDPYFESIVDNPPVLVKQNQKHGPGLIVLGPIPIVKSPMHYLTANSSHPSNRIRPRDMANFQTEMENRTDCQIRRPHTQPSVAVTATSRSRCN